MPHPAPRGLGTHSLSGTSLLPGAPWDGAGQAACSRPPPGPPRREPTLTATDTTRAPFAGDTEPSVRLAGCPCPTAGRRCRHSDTLSDAGEHLCSALVPKASTPPPTPGGEQAADPPEGTGRAWAGAGRWCRGGRWLFLMSSDDGPCLSPQAEGHSRRAGLQGAGGRLGPGTLSTGAPVWPAPGRVQSLGLHCAGRGRRRPQRQGCESTQREWSVVEAAGPSGLCSHRGTLPFPPGKPLRRGRGVILTLPHQAAPLQRGAPAGAEGALHSTEVPQGHRRPRATRTQLPSLSRPAHRAPNVAVAGGRGRRHMEGDRSALCTQTDRARSSPCLTVLKQT